MSKRKLVCDDDEDEEIEEFKASVVNQIIEVSDEDSLDSPLKTITTPINPPKKPKIQSTLVENKSTPTSKNHQATTTTPKKDLKLSKKGESSNSKTASTPKTPTTLNVNTNKSSLGSTSNNSSSKKQTLSPEESKSNKATTLGDILGPETKKEKKNAKSRFWNIANCQPVNYKDIEDWEDFVDTAEEKYLGPNRNNINVYIREEEVNVIYRWIESFKSAKSTLAARVARNVKERNDNSFDERVEEENWKKLNTLTARLKNLLMNHENLTTEDLGKMKECSQVRKKRIEEEKRENEQSEREHQALKNQSDIAQIKYFVFRDGPVRGQKEYFEWKSLINMKNLFSGAAAAAQNNQQPSFEDSDDELLNGDIF
ncbi:predicted protein [Naegleria gruberi]|uniref:Predicted protein n=1 Tax=Naegleria gruberi TaxID=5762 RepID=D2V7R1_NAEGR|nr:uncharacterized protein NAEGRDRAFT_64895 [Naegleria gruberi]EFC46916.1 predicted protein [Naegleria gruberi]|eukprot:XP_002679660.1 predicted protein [Naegleria gruberi strain NEG-M]